jgi:hypothetical protein
MSIATSLRFSTTTPAAPTGKQLIVPQNDAGVPILSQTFYDPVMVGDTGTGGLAGNVPAPAAGDAAAGKFLKADGSWQVAGGVGTFLDELITVTGTSGAFIHAPAVLIGLYKNGQRLTRLGASPDFSVSGTTITLTVAGVSTDVFEAIYFY